MGEACHPVQQTLLGRLPWAWSRGAHSPSGGGGAGRRVLSQGRGGWRGKFWASQLFKVPGKARKGMSRLTEV